MKGSVYKKNIYNLRKTREKNRNTNKLLEYSNNIYEEKIPKTSRILNFYQKFCREICHIQEKNKKKK